MTNISRKKREDLIGFLNTLKKIHTDDFHVRTLNEIENALSEKKYGLVWESHLEDVNVKLKDYVPIFTEQVDKSVMSNDSASLNFLLEGDNLHSLKLLEKTHRGGIDVIYIDPPYNMGKKDFTYNDRIVDKEDGYRHSKWISFMNERLRVAYRLLNDEGFIAISIDENEVSQLRLLCDEIFGEHNLLTVQHVQVRYTNKNLNERNDWQPVMEYVLIYAKDSSRFRANRPVEEYDIKGFNQSIEELTNGTEEVINDRKVTIFKKGEWKRVKHKDPHQDLLKSTWISGSIYSDTGHGTTYQRIVEPRTDIDGYGSLYKIEGLGEDGLGYRYMRNPNSSKYTRGEMFTAIPTSRQLELNSEAGSINLKPITNVFDYSAEFGNIRHEGGISFNKGKKPIKMLKEILNYHKRKDIIVLDFFAGSGSTAHATVSLNADDNGTRKYIMCTNNENNICEEITLTRLKNIQRQYPNDFKYYKTDFVKKFPDDDNYLSYELIPNIQELVELQIMKKIDNINYFLLIEQEEVYSIDALKLNKNSTFYISSNILLPRDIEIKFEELNISVLIIPEYYYLDELREVNEI